MKIRKINKQEVSFLGEMLYQAIFIPEGVDPLPRNVIKDPSLAKYIENWGKDMFDVAVVAEDDPQLVGAIWGRSLKAGDAGFGYIDDETPELSMAVMAEYRNQGLGTQLLQSIITEYQVLGITQLSLSVDKANPASRLYKRIGFIAVKETNTSWTMKLRI